MIKEAIQASQEAGCLTEAAAQLIMEIGENQIHKRTDIPRAAREDALGRYLEKALRKWTAIKPGQNPKAYFNRMAYTALMDELRSFDRHRKKMEHYKDCEGNEEKITPENKYVTPLDNENLLKNQGITDLRQLDTPRRTEIRRYALNLLNADISIGKVSRILGLHKWTVSRWKQRNTEHEQERGRPWPSNTTPTLAI